MQTITLKSLSAAIALALCVAAPAFAATQQKPVSPSDAQSNQVSLAGLDLATPEGMSAARERLLGTARLLCYRVAHADDLSLHANYVRCVNETLAGALRQVTTPAAYAGVTQPAIAPPTVSLADLDLATPEGARAAHQRLRDAARASCARVADPNQSSKQSEFVACVSAAMAKALPRVEALAQNARN
jgi:UrcA family protein